MEREKWTQKQLRENAIVKKEKKKKSFCAGQCPNFFVLGDRISMTAFEYNVHLCYFRRIEERIVTRFYSFVFATLISILQLIFLSIISNSHHKFSNKNTQIFPFKTRTTTFLEAQFNPKTKTTNKILYRISGLSFQMELFE